MSGYFQRLLQRGGGAAWDGSMQFVRSVPSLYGPSSEAADNIREGLETTEWVEPSPPIASTIRASLAEQRPHSSALATVPKNEAVAVEAGASQPDEKQDAMPQPVVPRARPQVQNIEVDRVMPRDRAAPSLPVPTAAAREAQPAPTKGPEPRESPKAPPPTLESLSDAIERPVDLARESAVQWPDRGAASGIAPSAPEPPTVSIGRININVAPPPAPQPVGPARTQGFRSYDALRRGLVR